MFKLIQLFLLSLITPSIQDSQRNIDRTISALATREKIEKEKRVRVYKKIQKLENLGVDLSCHASRAEGLKTGLQKIH